MIASALDAMFERGETTEFLEVSYANGEKEVLHFGDFVSGAMIESVVRRAKKLALKRCIGGGEKGLVTDDLVGAVREEFRENKGPAEHEQPGRLGEDRRQEGRAHRRRQVAGRPHSSTAAEHGEGRHHWPVPVTAAPHRRTIADRSATVPARALAGSRPFARDSRPGSRSRIETAA